MNYVPHRNPAELRASRHRGARRSALRLEAPEPILITGSSIQHDLLPSRQGALCPPLSRFSVRRFSSFEVVRLPCPARAQIEHRSHSTAHRQQDRALPRNAKAAPNSTIVTFQVPRGSILNAYDTLTSAVAISFYRPVVQYHKTHFCAPTTLPHGSTTCRSTAPPRSAPRTCRRWSQAYHGEYQRCDPQPSHLRLLWYQSCLPPVTDFMVVLRLPRRRSTLYCLALALPGSKQVCEHRTAPCRTAPRRPAAPQRVPCGVHATDVQGGDGPHLPDLSSNVGDGGAVTQRLVARQWHGGTTSVCYEHQRRSACSRSRCSTVLSTKRWASSYATLAL